MVHNRLIYLEKLERETRLELATSTLAKLLAIVPKCMTLKGFADSPRMSIVQV